MYQISVHPSDEAILHALKAFLKVQVILYTVSTTQHIELGEKLPDILQFIIPHFTAYPLQSTKYISFYLFKAVANIMHKKMHLTLQG